MSAIKKHDEPQEEHQPERETPASAAQLEDVSAATDIESAESPARAMQDHLHRSIQTPSRSSSVMDIGRVLAAASGITLILGVFIINGI